MRTIKLTLSYDGTDYAGWQIQPRQRTVQQALEDVVEKITGVRSSILASGRTDAGVHALGQVASFHSATRLSNEVLHKAINAQLPHDIAVHCVEDAPDGFHPIRNAVRKRYRYLISDGPVRDVFHLRYCWHLINGRLNVAAMQQAAATLVGTHDFTSYETGGAPRKSSVRTVYDIAIARGAIEHDRKTEQGSNVEEGRGEARGFVTLEVEANGFLYNMVRNIVGTLVDVGRGAESETWPMEVLDARDRCKAGRTAPPQGLFLLWVEYGPIAAAQNVAASDLEDSSQAEG